MGNCRSKKEENSDVEDANVNNNNNNNNHNNSMNHKSSQDINVITNLVTGRHDDKQYSTLDQDNNQMLSIDSVIYSTKNELNLLLKGIIEFDGTTEQDKNYRYLDEMLTRCILKLDNLECNNITERGNRRHAIRGVNQAITILERKLEINLDIEQLEINLSNLK